MTTRQSYYTDTTISLTHSQISSDVYSNILYDDDDDKDDSDDDDDDDNESLELVLGQPWV